VLDGRATEFLATIDWGAVGKRLIAYTLRRLARFSQGSATEEHAMDIVHDAIVHLLDDEHRNWCPNGEPTEEALMLHLGSEINGIVINRQRKVIRGPVHRAFDENGESSDHDPPGSTLEVATFLQRAQALLASNPDARSVLSLFAEGCIKASEQAQELGWPIRRVYKAREHVRAKLQEMQT